jgi:hypothetical protein
MIELGESNEEEGDAARMGRHRQGGKGDNSVQWLHTHITD